MAGRFSGAGDPGGSGRREGCGTQEDRGDSSAPRVPDLRHRTDLLPIHAAEDTADRITARINRIYELRQDEM